MKQAPKKWKAKVKRNLKKKIKMSDKSADIAVNDIWKHGMKPKCRTKVIEKYG